MCGFIFFFFFNDTATTEIYTLSLHDALPILRTPGWDSVEVLRSALARAWSTEKLFLQTHVTGYEESVCFCAYRDRKSTRLNSSHANISYAVFCLKKKKNKCRQSHSQYFYRSS